MSLAKQSSGLASRIDRRFATRLVRKEIWPEGLEPGARGDDVRGFREQSPKTKPAPEGAGEKLF
jgi:hypothetical protein